MYAGHEVSFCSDFKPDCWSTATGPRKWDGTLHLTFHRCKPYADVNKTFALDADCDSLRSTGGDGKYTRLKTEDGAVTASRKQPHFVFILADDLVN